MALVVPFTFVHQESDAVRITTESYLAHYDHGVIVPQLTEIVKKISVNHPRAEAAKTAKREVRRGERDIEKELRSVERSEKSLVAEIKKTAKTGNQVLRHGNQPVERHHEHNWAGY